jgi:AcrR family transcriptional regulator
MAVSTKSPLERAQPVKRTRRKTAPAPRPLRGKPVQTRERLVAAAADLFNRFGFHGTDSNRIAKAAGYSTGVFYKHFKDKREAFLAAYEAWSASEWSAVFEAAASTSAPEELARRLVMLAMSFHANWSGLRASLLELVFTDPEVRRFYRSQRRRQLDIIAELRSKRGLEQRTREDYALHLFTTERTFDAIAQGEATDLGLSRDAMIEAMVKNVLALLT